MLANTIGAQCRTDITTKVRTQTHKVTIIMQSISANFTLPECIRKYKINTVARRRTCAYMNRVSNNMFHDSIERQITGDTRS